MSKTVELLICNYVRYTLNVYPHLEVHYNAYNVCYASGYSFRHRKIISLE